MEREFIMHHIKEDDLGCEHLIASMQPRKYSKDYSKHSTKNRRILGALEALDNVFEVLDACRTQLQRAQGLVRPRVAGLLTGVEYSRVRIAYEMYLTSL